MQKPNFIFALTLISLMLVTTCTAQAQTPLPIAAATAPTPDTQDPEASAEHNFDWRREQLRKAIAGSWLLDVNITMPDCGCPPTKNLATFTEDGGVTGAAPVDTRQFLATPSHGTWEYRGGRTFAVTFLSLLYLPNGTLTGIFKLSATVTLNRAGDRWSGLAKSAITDPAGRLLFSYESTAQATRIIVEPLP